MHNEKKIEKFFEKIGNRYPHSLFIFPNIEKEYKNIRSKITVICPHGTEFKITADMFVRAQFPGTKYCPKCKEEYIKSKKTKYTKDNLVKIFKSKYPDLILVESETEFNANGKLTYFCPKHKIKKTVYGANVWYNGAPHCGPFCSTENILEKLRKWNKEKLQNFLTKNLVKIISKF